MYACPWCGSKTFSFWQKQTLGPARTLRCSSCSRQVSVSWDRAQIAALPVVILGFLGFDVDPQFQVLAELLPADLEDRPPLAEIDRLKLDRG